MKSTSLRKLLLGSAIGVISGVILAGGMLAGVADSQSKSGGAGGITALSGDGSALGPGPAVLTVTSIADVNTGILAVLNGGTGNSTINTCTGGSSALTWTGTAFGCLTGLSGGGAGLAANTFTGLQDATNASAGNTSLFYRLGATTTAASGNEVYLQASNDIGVAVNGSKVCDYTATGLNSCAIGATTVSSGGFTTFSAQTIKSTNGSIIGYGNLVPSISSGFGTSPSITTRGNSYGFQITIGSGGTAQTGVVTMPAATSGTGWACHVNDVTTTSATVDTTKETATTTTSVTVGDFTSAAAAGAWAAGDVLQFSCVAI